MMWRHVKQHIVNENKTYTTTNIMEREIGEDATNNTSDQAVNQFRGKEMRRGEAKCNALCIALLFLFVIIIHPLIISNY